MTTTGGARYEILWHINYGRDRAEAEQSSPRRTLIIWG